MCGVWTSLSEIKVMYVYMYVCMLSLVISLDNCCNDLSTKVATSQ